MIYVTNIEWELTSLFVCLLLDFINLLSGMSEDLNTLHTLWCQKITNITVFKIFLLYVGLFQISFSALPKDVDVKVIRDMDSAGLTI